MSHFSDKMTYQSEVSLLPSRNIRSKSETFTFSIEEHLQNQQYVSTNANLKWPFVGNQFDRVQWKSGIVHDVENVRTTLQVS